jgi:hypothetical protein
MHPGETILDQWASWLAMDAPLKAQQFTWRVWRLGIEQQGYASSDRSMAGARLASIPVATRLGESWG